MKFTIEYLDGINQGKKQEFVQEVINIGSSPINDIVIRGSKLVCTNHAMIQWVGESFIIINHSLNGTYVNNSPVKKAPLPDSGIIRLGLKGHSFRFQIIRENVESSAMSNTEEQRRWYDRDTLISKAMDILKKADDETATKVAQSLIDILNKQDPKAIFIRSDINIDDEIKSLPREVRWYDLNKLVQKIIESLKLCNPEMKEKLAIQMIMMLEPKEEPEIAEEIDLSDFEEINKPDRDNQGGEMICPKCRNSLPANAIFCDKCGFKIQGGYQQGNYNDDTVIPEHIYRSINSRLGPMARSLRTYPGGPRVLFAKTISISCMVLASFIILNALWFLLKAFVYSSDFGSFIGSEYAWATKFAWGVTWFITIVHAFFALILFGLSAILEMLIDIRNFTSVK